MKVQQKGKRSETNGVESIKKKFCPWMKGKLSNVPVSFAAFRLEGGQKTPSLPSKRTFFVGGGGGEGRGFKSQSELIK